MSIMGRPQISEEEKRKVQVNIRLTEAEHRKVKLYAQSSGITPAHWIRKKVFTGSFPSVKISPIDAALYQELHKIVVNLNQAVKQVHNARQGAVPVDMLTKLLKMLFRLVKDVLITPPSMTIMF